MAERYKPVPHVYEPWEERFESEAKHHTSFPFPPGRKGKKVEAQPRKPKGLAREPARGRWGYTRTR